ncbi:prepilin peptidase [Rhodococcus erythropolis]|uniref:prepilin peptidase n=1 Tax=Rhodococcus erythropolis TaxID=1833 RepID=UPI001BE67F84|nr:prepilin peptidase [Rhodococcus erythropolis]MBT2269637.1 prepilin peptidase [Rhodococcus erythropolis]
MGSALPAVLAMSAIAMWCGVVDQATMRIPTSAAYTAAATALLLIVVAGLVDSDASAIVRAVAGGFATMLMYLLVAWATGGGLGFGDVRLSLSLGLVLGYQGWPSVGAGLIWPVIVLFPVAIGTVIHRRITGSTATSREIAAGPGLVAGCALALALNG